LFRRPRFRPIRQIVRNQNLTVLRQAHELLSIGEFERAAVIYEQLALGAQARRIPQDAHLFLIAGGCRIQARQIDLAMEDLKQGLEILSARGRTRKFIFACQKSKDELLNAGYNAEAAEIMQLLGSSIGSPLSIQHPDADDRRGTLPAACAACGGTLHSDDVDWIDNVTAECPWCGSSIRAN
jgi:hypothetical protein